LRQIDKYRFEYLLVFKGKFYGTFIHNKLEWWQFYRMFCKESVNNKELQSLIHFLSKAAETTIETLRSPDKEIAKKVANKIIKKT